MSITASTMGPEPWDETVYFLRSVDSIRIKQVKVNIDTHNGSYGAYLIMCISILYVLISGGLPYVLNYVYLIMTLMGLLTLIMGLP